MLRAQLLLVKNNGMVTSLHFIAFLFVCLFVCLFYFQRGRRTPNELGIKKNISLRPHSTYAGAQGPRSDNRDVGTVYFDLDTVATPKKKVHWLAIFGGVFP